MRLIDVTDLEKFIRKNVCAIGDDHLLLVAGDDGRWHEALPLVKTAYSVDKVVDELDSLRITGNSLKFDLISYNKAIENVKHGGVSTDVCEWRLCDEEANVYDTSCRNPHILIEGTPKENNYEYCPYCGKKIKVVE